MFGIIVGVYGEFVLVCIGLMCGVVFMIWVFFDFGDGVIDDCGYVFVVDKE